MNQPKDKWENMHSTKGRVFSGVLIVAVGVVLLLKQLGMSFPEWLFTWEVAIILIGIYLGIKHNFKHNGWLVLLVIGGVLLIDDVYPETNLENYLWPALIILFGLIMISTAGKRKERWKEWKSRCRSNNVEESVENMLDAVSIMGGIKKSVITKEFKGGEVTCIFGGAEINLSQADFEGKVILEITQIFGGTLLIVPSNWEIQSENVAILGGIEDKRNMTTHEKTTNKILVLKGVTIFGGIDIKSYSTT
ncbi:MAG: LiaF transmembrane domain-containing protein [Bacteroidota bacterium]|jgi:predicted membrane protein